MTPPFPPPYDPFDPKTWPKPNQNNPQNNPQQNFPPQQNQNPPFPPPPNSFQQNPYQQLPPWQLQGQIPFHAQRALPNAGAVLALGIIGIVGSFCYVIPGFVCSIIGLIIGNGAVRAYKSNPTAYTNSSYGNAKAGRICAIIGLSLSCVIILLLILAVAINGDI